MSLNDLEDSHDTSVQVSAPAGVLQENALGTSGAVAVIAADILLSESSVQPFAEMNSMQPSA